MRDIVMYGCLFTAIAGGVMFYSELTAKKPEKEVRMIISGLLLFFGGILAGVGISPSKGAPDGVKNMYICGFVLIALGVLAFIAKGLWGKVHFFTPSFSGLIDKNRPGYSLFALMVYGGAILLFILVEGAAISTMGISGIMAGPVVLIVLFGVLSAIFK